MPLAHHHLPVVIVLSAAAALPATLAGQGGVGQLPTVTVFSSFECVAPGLPPPHADSLTHRVLAALLRIGDEHRVLVDGPGNRVRFGYVNRVVSPRGTESDLGGFVHTKREQASWDYARGVLRGPGQDWSWEELSVLLWKPTERNEYAGVLVRIPHVSQLTSRVFVDRHCFRVRREGTDPASDLFTVAFSAPADSRYIEFVGELVLDLARREIAEARLALSRFPDWGAPIESFEIRMAFTRRPSGASVIDSVLATQRFARSAEYRGSILSRVEGYRRLWP
jgi:hypothetical protein